MLPLKIAWRFLVSSKSQTLFIMFGIAIGVSVQIFIGLLIQSLQISLIDRTIGSSSHITLRVDREDPVFLQTDIVLQTIDNSALMKSLKAVSAVSETPVFIKTGKNDLSGFMRGFDFARANTIYHFDEKLKEGSLPVNDNEVLIGSDLQKLLGLKTGETFNITVPTFVFIPHTVKIVGIFDLGIAGLNRSWVVSTLSTVQNLIRKPTTYSAIEIQVKEVFQADVLATSIRQLFKEKPFTVTDWKSENQELLGGLSGQTISSLFIQVFVMISVALAISSVLIISVVQKNRQIGILKAMGIKDSSTSLIFLAQGLLLGVGGALLGVLLGLGLSLSFAKFAVSTQGKPIVPLIIDYAFILLSAGIAVASALIASIIPARKSAKLSPIEVIRNG